MRFIYYFFILILFFVSVKASDEQAYFICGGDEQTIFICGGDEQNSIIGSDVIPPIFYFSILENYEFGKLQGEDFVENDIYYGVIEDNLASVSWILTFPNGSIIQNLTAGKNQTISLKMYDFGGYFLYVNATDSFGNSASSIRNFKLSLVSGASGSISEDTDEEIEEKINETEEEFNLEKEIEELVNKKIEDIKKFVKGKSGEVLFWGTCIFLVFLGILVNRKRKKGKKLQKEISK